MPPTLRLKSMIWCVGLAGLICGQAQFSVGQVAKSRAVRDAKQADYTGWNQFHRFNMTRFNTHEKILNVSNVGKLVQKWSFSPTGYLFGEQPAVADGVVYVGSEGYLFALRASDGKRLWTFQTKGRYPGPTSAPAVSNGIVYLNSETQSGSNQLVAVNAKNGKLIWELDTSGGFVGASAPAVIDGVVYVGMNDGLYALDAASGTQLWTFAHGACPSSPAVVNGVVYSGCSDTVYALDASTGIQLWSFSGSVFTSSPAVANGTVYIGSRYGILFALNASTGNQLWTFGHADDWMIGSPAVANGIVYVGSEDSSIHALHAHTGKEIWSRKLDGQADIAPTVANGVLYTATVGGHLYAFNAQTGAVRWKNAASGWGSAVIVNGILYFPATYSRTMFAFGLPN